MFLENSAPIPSHFESHNLDGGVSIGLCSDQAASGGQGGGAAAAAADRLDKVGENRTLLQTPLVDLLQDGQFAVKAVRGGGPFDIHGVRRDDVARSDAITQAVDHTPGRWMMVTLTVDRSHWLPTDAGLQACYSRCQERVREVAQAIVDEMGLWVSTLELQTKTGAGFPHWHLMVKVPDNADPDQVRRTVRRKWMLVVDHHVCEVTGEVTQSKESIGFIDVQDCRTSGGSARYLAKYICKPWAALPSWMLNSDRQLRKYRCSRGFFDLLAALKLHTPKRGSRRQPSGRRRAARPLLDRMSTSCTTSIVLQRVQGKLRFRRSLPAPVMSDRWVDRYAAKPLRAGKVPAVAWLLDGDNFRAVCRDVKSPEFAEESESLTTYQRGVIGSAWDEMQSKGVDDDPGGSVVGAGVDSPGGVLRPGGGSGDGLLRAESEAV